MRRAIPVQILISGLLLWLTTLSAQTGQAQETEPLIREDRTTVTVRRGSRDEQPPATPTPGGQGIVVPTPTPDPEKVLVAIVNQHSLTRAKLDRLVSARADRVKEVIEEREGTLDPADLSSPSGEALDNFLLEEQQIHKLRSAIRAEEGEIVREWVDQMMLADEARRHGFAISTDELETRMNQIDKEFGLSDEKVANFLETIGMTRHELEVSIYDALLVEKLLQRWVELNIPESRMREVYSQNPGVYVTPPLYHLAMFTVSLLGDEASDELKGLKEEAEKARRRLAKGEPHTTVFEEMNDVEYGYLGIDLGYCNIRQSGLLPPIVLKEVQGMKAGQVSPVVTSYRRRQNGEIYPESYHVVKVIDIRPEEGRTFESALPKIRESALVVARDNLLRQVRDSQTHRVIISLSGIAPDKVPSASDLSKPEPPVPLRLGSQTAQSN